MSNTGATHHYDELTSEPDSPVIGTTVQDFEKGSPEGDAETGTLQRETTTESKKTSGVSRALQSIRWKRAAREQGEVEKTELAARKPPEYTDEARKLVRSFTRVNFDSDTKENR